MRYNSRLLTEAALQRYNYAVIPALTENRVRDMAHETVGRAMEILLVEDSLTFARVAIGALKSGQVQHRLTWLADGAEAWEF